MDKGYLLIALNSGDTDYNRLAYACALSIKLTQSSEYSNVSVLTDDPEYFKDKEIFDKVITYSSSAKGMDARSRAYEYTPYDRTVLLDSDMLMLKPMDLYWDMCENMDLYISTAPQNHRGRKFKYGFYRKFFDKHKLTDVYNAWTYFKKSDTAKQFFDTVKLITDNPKEFLEIYAPVHEMNTVPTDEAFAIALELMDFSMPNWDFPRITHMKSQVQNWKNTVQNWNDVLRFQMNSNGEVSLGVWAQTELLHYVNKDLITDSIIQVLENAL